MKISIAIIPALALLASASPFHFKDTPGKEDASFEHLRDNTTTPGVESLPTCAIPCIQIAVKTASNCELTDLPCLCKKRAKIAMEAKSCIVSTCGAKTALKKVRPQVQALCKLEDEKEKKRYKEEKAREKAIEKARKKAAKEEKQRNKEQKQEEKERKQEKEKKQREKELEDELKQKEDDEKREKQKQEDNKAWKKIEKERKKKAKEDAKKAKEDAKKKKEGAMTPEQREEVRKMRLEHPPNEDPFHMPDYGMFHGHGRQ